MKRRKSWGYVSLGAVVLILAMFFAMPRPKQVIIISHRGSPLSFPEHSFAGYDNAIKQGSRYLEQDVILSKDNQLMISHDNNLKRLFKQDLNITEMTETDFKKIKQTNGESLHTMAEVFDHYQKQVTYVVETKEQANGKFKLEDELIKLIKEKKMAKQVIFQSFSIDSLKYLRQTFKANEYMLLADNLELIDTTDLADIDIICLNYQHLDNEVIEKIHSLGKKAYAYTVNDEKDMVTLVDSGLDGFFTNDTKLGLEVQKR